MINLKNFKNFVAILEERGSDIAVRTVVRDIINLVKSGRTGSFILPHDRNTNFTEYISPQKKLRFDYKTKQSKKKLEYDFVDLPMYFWVSLKIKHNTKLKRFRINASAGTYDIDLIIEYNPNFDNNTFWHELSGELNIDIAHEIEHLLQWYSGEFEDFTRNYNNNYEYYTLADELPAQIAGFKRLYDLERERNSEVKFQELVKNWFYHNRFISKLSQVEEDAVIMKITNSAKQKYPDIK